MFTRDTLIRTVIEHESGALVSVVKREYINDDGSVEFTRTLDEGAGLRFQDEKHLDNFTEIQASVEAHVLPLVREKLDNDMVQVFDGVEVLNARIVAAVAAAERAAELKTGLQE